MRQLVRQQPAAGGSVRPEFSGTEHDVVSDGVGQSGDCTRRRRRRRVVVQAHRAQIATETRFEEGQRSPVERPALHAQGLVDHRRSPGRGPYRAFARLASQRPFVFVLALRAFAPGRWRSHGTHLKARTRRFGHPHDLVGDRVGFLLINIARRVYGEFRLKPCWRFGMRRYLAEIMPKPRRHECARCWIKCLPRRAQRVTRNWRDGIYRLIADG